MIYSDITLATDGLIQDCEMSVFGNYGDITNSTDRKAEFNARINRAYDKAATLIMSADGRWQWDDTNYTTLPIGSTNLVSGQMDYGMDVEHLEVLKVVALTSSGVKKELTPYSITDSMGTIEAENITTNGGIPTWYRKTGSSFVLYPTPNYDYTGGLIVYFQRKPSYFATTDTTKSPGIPYMYHRFLSLDASVDYALWKQLPIKNDADVKLKEMQDSLIDFYSKRSKDEPKFVRPIHRSSR